VWQTGGALHGALQAPQLAASVMKFVHNVGIVLLGQPFGAPATLHEATHDMPLQMAFPPVGGAGHVVHVPPQFICVPGHGPHIPLLHIAPIGHANAAPQPPQLFASVAVLTHVFVPAQRVGAEPGHDATHDVPLHPVVPPEGGGGHVVHVPPQFICVPGHVHTLLTHVAVGGHAMLQPLQLAASLVMSTQLLPQRVWRVGSLVHAIPQLIPSHVATPFVGIGQAVQEDVPHELVEELLAQALAQTCCMEGHAQALETQVAPVTHAVAQVPQCAGLLVVLTSHPSEGVALQSAKPVLHDAMAHIELMHAGVAFGVLHAEQPPQWAASFVKLKHAVGLVLFGQPFGND
jgi:hypothetical protein